MDEKKMFAGKGNKLFIKQTFKNSFEKTDTCIDLDSFYSRSLSASKWFKLRKLLFNTWTKEKVSNFNPGICLYTAVSWPVLGMRIVMSWKQIFQIYQIYQKQMILYYYELV